jgi:hypothetical protein
MTALAQRLLQQARRLSDRERAALASALLLTLDDDGEDLTPQAWEAAWDEEIQRRAAEVRSGKVALVDGPRVLRQVRASLKRAR